MDAFDLLDQLVILLIQYLASRLEIKVVILLPIVPERFEVALDSLLRLFDVKHFLYRL